MRHPGERGAPAAPPGAVPERPALGGTGLPGAGGAGRGDGRPRSTSRPGLLAFAFLCGLLLAAIIGHGAPPGGVRAVVRAQARGVPRSPGLGGDAATALGSVRSAARAPALSASNADPDALHARLRRMHVSLLALHPLLQRLPWSDRSVGVSLAGLSADRRILLTITFHGSLAAARSDFAGLLARIGDRGTGYAVRFVALPVLRPSRSPGGR